MLDHYPGDDWRRHWSDFRDGHGRFAQRGCACTRRPSPHLRSLPFIPSRKSKQCVCVCANALRACTEEFSGGSSLPTGCPSGATCKAYTSAEYLKEAVAPCNITCKSEAMAKYYKTLCGPIMPNGNMYSECMKKKAAAGSWTVAKALANAQECDIEERKFADANCYMVADKHNAQTDPDATWDQGTAWETIMYLSGDANSNRCGYLTFRDMIKVMNCKHDEGETRSLLAEPLYLQLQANFIHESRRQKAEGRGGRQGQGARCREYIRQSSAIAGPRLFPATALSWTARQSVPPLKLPVDDDQPVSVAQRHALPLHSARRLAWLSPVGARRH